MNRRAVAEFARRFREVLERDGIAALERFDWAGGFFGLGFEMGCGHAYEEAYGLRLGDADGIGDLSRVDDMTVLGSAVFSQCRYLTHWSGGYGEREAGWLVAALRRLEELSGRSPCVAAAYRFEDAVEGTLSDFFERALPGEEPPAFVEYRVRDTMTLDADVDEVLCTVALPGGDVDLEIKAGQSAWRYEGQPASEREPWATVTRATRVAEDEETGDEVALAWDDELGRWERSEGR